MVDELRAAAERIVLQFEYDEQQGFMMWQGRTLADALKLARGYLANNEPSEATVQQPGPQPASGDIWLEVIEDMKQRRQMGINKYGTPVQAGNGRKALVGCLPRDFGRLSQASNY